MTTTATTKVFTITGTSPASASTAVIGSPIVGLDRFSSLQLFASLVGATGGTLDVYVQCSFDGTTWFDCLHFPQLAAGAAAVKYVDAGVFPTNFFQAVGTNLTPALAANNTSGLPIGDRLRVVATAGASTSAGATVTIQFFGKLPPTL